MSLPELDVVVVEDSHPIRRILRTILTASGVGRVRAFSSARAAMTDMQQSPPDFLITDWRMHPVSGYELIRMIRRDIESPLCRVPVIMLSGYALQRYVEQALLIGVHQFLVKPVSPKILLQRIDWILNDSRPFVIKDGTCQISGTEKMRQAMRQRKQRLVFLNACCAQKKGRLPVTGRHAPRYGDGIQPGDRDATGEIWEI